LNFQPQHTNSTSTATQVMTSTKSPTSTTSYLPSSIVTSTVGTNTQPPPLSVSTPIPGFPGESIILGSLLGSLVVALIRRRK
jgi:hypothetical protein